MTTEAKQRDAFVAVEGDGYFSRNKDRLSDTSPIKDLVTSRLAHHLGHDRTSNVLEIGCSSGENLIALNSLAPIRGCGIDPSAEAVRVGRNSHPTLDLRVGTAEALPFEDDSMDAIWFGFCLYLVDRKLLHRAVCEADRVLKDGGLIAIHDFDPDLPCARPYRHFPGLMSYKMDYSRLFLADPAYSLAEKTCFNHHDLTWVGDPQERLALWICRRDRRIAYKLDQGNP